MADQVDQFLVHRPNYLEINLDLQLIQDGEYKHYRRNLCLDLVDQPA